MAEEKTYLQGYNQGFKLRKYSPELYELLKDSLSEQDEFQKGVIQGAAQADLEAENSRLAELNELTNQHEQENELEQ